MFHTIYTAYTVYNLVYTLAHILLANKVHGWIMLNFPAVEFDTLSGTKQSHNENTGVNRGKRVFFTQKNVNLTNQEAYKVYKKVDKIYLHLTWYLTQQQDITLTEQTDLKQ